MPFGLAMVAACVGETIPIIGVFIMAILGTCIGNGLAATGNFLLTSIIYFVLVILFKFKVAVEERNEVIKTGGKLFFSCFIIPFIKTVTGVFLFYDVFMAFVSASLVYVFYKLFVNGLVIIENYKLKTAYTIEELIASSIIIAIASTALNSINFFGLSISKMVGAVSGISIGLAISFVSDVNIVQVSMFAVSGILAGMFNRFGKIGVILGFLLGNIIITYWVRGASNVILYFRELFIASIGLFLVPNNLKIDLEELYGKNKLISDAGDNRLEEGSEKIVSDSLRSISDLFDSLNSVPNKEEIIYQENLLQDFLDNVEELQDNILYEEISNEDNGIAKDICDVMIKNDIIVDKDLISILQEHNNYVFMRDENTRNDLQEIIKIANRTLKAAQINRIKKQEKTKAMKAANESLKTIGDVVKKHSEKASNISKTEEYVKKEKEIILLLESKKIGIQAVDIKKLKNKKLIIDLKLDYNDLRLREKEVMTNLCDIISKSIGTKMALQREKIDEEKKTYNQIYSSEDKFVLQVGSAKIAKDGNNVSGDCSLQTKLVDGKYLLAISDGMGSGEKARECSKITLKLMKQIMASGFDSDDTVKLLNAKMNLINKSDMYSSLDASVLDLYTGKIDIIKNGASNTYIKSKKSINKVESKNLPIGIVENIELQRETINVNDGDILVMCSDGVLDTKDSDNSEWLEKFLKNISTNNVQKIADLILAEAIDNNFGVAQDDMTVIVSKIVGRK